MKRKPNQSARNLSKKLKINRETTRQLLKGELKLKPYKIQKKQLLSKASVFKRLSRVKNLKKRFCKHANDILFTDEKIFTVQQSFNKQNSRAWVQNSQEARQYSVSICQKPASVMVWAGITRTRKNTINIH